MEMPDINGTLRGKVASMGKGLGPAGTGVSSLVMSFRSADDISLTCWSDVANGFPKITAVPDLDTVVAWPWRPDTAAVLCDFYMDDGTPCAMDGRHALRRVIAEFEALGIEPHAAIEWEFYVYAEDDELLRTGRHRELLSLGRQLHCYTLTNAPSFEPFATEFIERMEDVGITVEAFHSEYGRGQYEFTCYHAPALKAADDAMRAKTYLKQLAAERGLVATFMPAIHVTTPDARNGAHVNVSLWRDGKNAFWDAKAGSLSDLGRQAAAGMMATMPDFHLFFRPYVNSYRRMDRLSWNPEDASWGVDNHSVAIRVVHGSNPSKLTRFEHRAPGSDLSPYFALASMLWGALEGIKGELAPPEYAIGDPFDEPDRYLPLPHSLADSVAAFRSSRHARQMLGDAFVDHFSAMKSDEWQDYATWAKDNDVDESETTDWEFRHYFEWV
jgi:glutamine synthetase